MGKYLYSHKNARKFYTFSIYLHQVFLLPSKSFNRGVGCAIALLRHPIVLLLFIYTYQTPFPYNVEVMKLDFYLAYQSYHRNNYGSLMPERSGADPRSIKKCGHLLLTDAFNCNVLCVISKKLETYDHILL